MTNETSVNDVVVTNSAVSQIPQNEKLLELLSVSEKQWQTDFQAAMATFFQATDPIEAKSIGQMLMSYTTALKIRASLSGAGDTDLSSDDYAALGLELGDDADRDLVNITLRQALAEGRQPSELKTLTETRLADFAALSQWANQSSVLSNVSVASEIDLSTQFMQLESKLNSVMPDGSAVSAMTSTLREQFALTNQEYVLVQLNELNDARAVQSFTLPDSIISLSEFGALSLQGLDSNQQWQPIESFNQDSLQSSGILQGINLDGFTALRLIGPANTPLSEREKIIGDSIELTLAGISEAPAKTDLLGVEVLTEYPLELVHRLVDTTSASDFQSYLKLAKTIPLLDAILGAQSERIGSMSAEDEQAYFTTLVKVCLSVEEKLSSGEMSHSFETLGQLDLAEFNALTGLTLETEEQLSEKLDVLATFYTNNQDLSFAISHFRDLSWENNDKLLLNESLESLNAKAVALAMESAQSDEGVESLKKVTSAIKFKKLLTGTDEGEVTLNAEDFNHFGFEPIAGQDFAQIAQAISAAAKQGEVTERKLVEFVNTINITDSESDAILEALLNEDEEVIQTLSLSFDNNLQADEDLLREKFADNPALLESVLEALWHSQASTETVLGEFSIGEVAPSYIEFVDESGSKVAVDAPIKARLIRGEGNSDEVSLAADQSDSGTYLMGPSVDMTDVTSIQLIALGNNVQVSSATKINVITPGILLSAEKLETLGYEHYSEEEIESLKIYAEFAKNELEISDISEIMSNFESVRPYLSQLGNNDLDLRLDMDSSKLGRSFAESLENLISTPTLVEFNEYLDSRPKSLFVRNTDESVERLELNAYEEKLAGLQETIGDEINRTNTEHTSELALWSRLLDDSHTNEVMS